jgi:hypothetical protein
MSQFDYRRNRRQQLVAKGEPIDNNIDFSRRTNTDFLNTFVAKMKDTNISYARQSPGSFNDQESDIVRANLVREGDGFGKFNDPTQQIKSDAFVNKFRISRMVPEDQKPNRSTILQYIEGDPKDPPVNGQFPTDGVKVT